MRSGRFPRFRVATDVVCGFVDEPGRAHLQTVPSSRLKIEENLPRRLRRQREYEGKEGTYRIFFADGSKRLRERFGSLDIVVPALDTIGLDVERAQHLLKHNLSQCTIVDEEIFVWSPIRTWIDTNKLAPARVFAADLAHWEQSAKLFNSFFDLMMAIHSYLRYFRMSERRGKILVVRVPPLKIWPSQFC